MKIIRLHSENILLAIDTIEDRSHVLSSEELVIWKKLNEKRRKEFSTSRHMAKELLQSGGEDSTSVLTHKDGRPLWSPGITGSISHSEKVCFVAVSDQPELLIGIDVQKIITVNVDFARRVLTHEELDQLLTKDAWNVEITALFSIKESIIKLCSNLKIKLDFTDITVALLNRKRFRARIDLQNLEFHGIYRVVQGFVYSGTVQEAF